MILHLFPRIFWAILTTLAVTSVAIKAAIRFQRIDELSSSSPKFHQRSIPKAGLEHPYHRLVNLGLPSHAVLKTHRFVIVSGYLTCMALPFSPLWASVIFFMAARIGLFRPLWLNTEEL